MSQNELTAKIRELRELKRMQEELSGEIEAIQDDIKQHMDAAQADTLTGADYKVTYKAVTSSRLDTSALKKALPDIAERFTKQTTTKRFVIV